MWCQIVINYQDYHNDKLTRLKAGVLARKIVRTIRPICRRSFYLYEFFLKNPHIFVAFELKSKAYLPLARLYVAFLRAWIVGDKIRDILFRERTKDYRNGEVFLNVLSIWCNQLADNYDSFFKQQPARIKGLKHLHHMTHCMMNAAFGMREFESAFYGQMKDWYGVPGSTLKKK